MTPLIVALPFCLKDSKQAGRLLEWIQTLDGQIAGHMLLLVADDAVPIEEKARIKDLGKAAFAVVETISIKAPAPVGSNYAVPAAMMFGKAALHIDACLKWNWLWLEPDAVPLRVGWLDALAEAYDLCPKRFMGPIIHADQPGVPKVHMAGTALYPNCAGPELKKFCDGKHHFDMQMADYVVPRAQDTNLIFHRWGGPDDPPTFKEVKLPADGPNVGTLDILPPEAVLFHRCKEGSLIELLKERNAPLEPISTTAETGRGVPSSEYKEESYELINAPKRRPGRPPKAAQPSEPETI